MKKFFSFFSVVLFAGSMMATDVTILPTDFTAATESDYSVTKDGVKVAVTASTVNSDQMRIFKDKTITISSDSSISKIVFTCTANGTAKYGPGNFAPQAGYTFETDGKTGTWTGAATSVTFTAANAQVRATKIEVTIGGEVPSISSVKYYVAGSMNNWAANDAYMLTPANNGEYKGEFTFAANDEFKVIGVEGETTTWFPGGMNNNFVINEAGDYKITFNPAGGVDGWYEGYFHVMLKQDPVIPHYEVAEAIAAGLADDDEVFVRGIITKMQIKGKNFAKYGSVNIYVKDATGAEGEFEFFNCYSLDTASFTTTAPAYDATSTAWLDLKKVADAEGNVIRLGDTVVAYGKYKLFNTTHELNTGCYLTDIKSIPVKPADTITVNMSEGLYFSNYVGSEGWWQIYGEDGKFDISVSNVSTTQAEGTYTIADLDMDYTYLGIINGTDTSYISFMSGAVTLSFAENGDVTVAGQLVGDDDNIYNLNLYFVCPKAQTTVTVNIQEGVFYDEYAEMDLYAVYGEDENHVYVQLALWAENGFQGTFTDLDLDYQLIDTYIEDGEEYPEIYTATITVTPGNGYDYTVTADALCYNNKLYKITMYIPATGQGIEGLDAAVKALKRIVNGQLVIEKAGKKYSVIGAEIR